MHIMQVAELLMMKLMPFVSKKKGESELANVARAVCVCVCDSTLMMVRNKFVDVVAAAGVESDGVQFKLNVTNINYRVRL